MTYLPLLVLLFFTSLPSFAENEKQIKKFEDLFIWKVSDELKLTHKEETLVSEIIRDINKRKQQSNIEIETLYKNLKDETSESGRKAVFNKIRAAHKNQLGITLDELDRMNKGIGLKKLGQYLELKRDLTEKIKSIWTNSEKKSDKDLPPPKVIEEK
jgi:hypothetical protein